MLLYYVLTARLQAGMTTQQAVFYNLLSCVLAFIGMVAGLLLGTVHHFSAWMLAATAGDGYSHSRCDEEEYLFTLSSTARHLPVRGSGGHAARAHLGPLPSLLCR